MMQEEAAVDTRKPFSTLQEEEELEDEELTRMLLEKKKKRKKFKQQRRRRRSSARFLHLAPGDEQDGEEDEEEAAPESEQLGELYKRAIRMNAENRINAGNSWGLRLIENMDKLVSNEETTGDGINFTKASCTLDASVKIYSYRVDDVHLTSYKVLANLNRNDATEKKSKKASSVTDDDNDNENIVDQDDDDHERTKERKTMETLETNMANLNINKLDAAYDIDPLFHKMSKTFDEGGAKGLLLVNLTVSANGCNIVFDSKHEEVEETKEESEGMVDITTLTSKLGDMNMDQLELVPQLRTLRQEYAVLEDEGFITHDVKKSRRYATSQEEEKEAEMSIHQDFLERSRMSIATTQVDSAREESKNDTFNNSSEYAADDYGGDDDDDDGDYGFDNFITNDADVERYSSISFQNEPFGDGGNTQTATLLDVLCSAEQSQNDYEFFSQETLLKLSGNNLWAGSQHWKKTQHLQRKTTAPIEKALSVKKKKKIQQFLDFTMSTENFRDMLKPGAKLELSKAMQAKYTKNDNVLPLDAGMGIDQLSKLFLRPTAMIRSSPSDMNNKTVGFHDTVNFAGDYDDGSYGDHDNDGQGFDFVEEEEEDFQIASLDVRKVDKVRVGYATVAKKVDVKRLKKDLWTELEANFGADEEKEEAAVGEEERPTKQANVVQKDIVSFRETVQEMNQSQAQTDVTLPFYFICLLHLANEKGLRLESQGLYDMTIRHDDGVEEEGGSQKSSKRSVKPVVYQE